MENVEKAGWTGTALGFISGMALALALTLGGPAQSHNSINKESVRVAGPALCAEDARLVPVKHHYYNAESVSGWTYTCKNFDEKGQMAK